MKVDRRRISDIKARYILEPTVRDVYVEGATDERFIRYALRNLGLSEVSVVRIDLLEVPDDLLARENLLRGEKSELIAAARELERQLGPTDAFTAIVDADSDRMLRITPASTLVQVTDYTCMEMYWLTDRTVDRFTSLLGLPQMTADELARKVWLPVTEVFLIRAAAIALRLPLEVKPFAKYVQVEEVSLRFDSERYTSMLLNCSNLHGSKQSLAEKIGSLRLELDPDLRHSGQGHDLFTSIVLLLKRILGAAGLREEAGIVNALWWAVDLSEIATEHLFVSLCKRCTVTPA